MHRHTKYEHSLCFQSGGSALTRFLYFDPITPNNHEALPEAIGSLYSMWHNYIPQLILAQAYPLQLYVLQNI